MLVVEAEKISERGEGRGGEREWERRKKERERRWEAWGRVISSSAGWGSGFVVVEGKGVVGVFLKMV